MKLLGHRSAADHFPALQHHRLESAFGQIKRGNQSVVPPANNHYFLSEWHPQFPACARAELFAPFHSFKITWLAILPGAAMIPPPGWVADPHIYKPSTGVL